MAEIPGKNRPIRFIIPAPPFNIDALQQRKINAILEDTGGTLWFGTSAGLVKIDPDGSYQVITNKDGLSSNIITCILRIKKRIFGSGQNWDFPN
jgi:hypothetical protein